MTPSQQNESGITSQDPTQEVDYEAEMQDKEAAQETKTEQPQSLEQAARWILRMLHAKRVQAASKQATPQSLLAQNHFGDERTVKGNFSAHLNQTMSFWQAKSNVPLLDQTIEECLQTQQDPAIFKFLDGLYDALNAEGFYYDKATQKIAQRPKAASESATPACTK